MLEQLEAIEAQHSVLSEKLASPELLADPKAYGEASKKLAQLTTIVGLLGELRTLRSRELHRITVTCACGSSFETHSTKSELRLEICNACHPFFTGKQKLVDSAGRVERFQRRYGLQSTT